MAAITLADIIQSYDDEFNKKLEELEREAKEDLSFGDLDQKGTDYEIMKNVIATHKWADKQSRQKQHVKRSQNSVTRIQASLYDSCKREVLDVAMKGSKEIEGWVCRQPKYAKALSYLNDQECILEFMERTLDGLKSRGFALRNIIENRKFFYEG